MGNAGGPDSGWASAPLDARWLQAHLRRSRQDGALYHRLELELPDAPPVQPGQFLLLGFGSLADPVLDPLLPRPMSILAASSDCLEVLLKVVGRGSSALARLHGGDPLRVLGPLGRGFTIAASPPPILVGGGVGVPPLHFLSRQLGRLGIEHRLIFGFNTATDIPRDLMAELDVEPEFCTLDASEGFAGNPVQLLDTEPQRPPARIQACGPAPMLEALRRGHRSEDLIELSLEERMACGVGVCRACVQALRDEDGDWRYATICREGPVFAAESLHPGEGADAVEPGSRPAPGGRES